ncbi:DUF5919 domain-containing protein [Nonomuraea sp. NPDC050786]|uniref:DUF5919 domain-containing protein n=1 Tax=Nonomuraea sp. NPDC050786 TaxID=3154840 RepID=UPI0033D20F5B
MTDQQILLKKLLTQRHWQTYSTFCKEYDKAAKKVDPSLQGGWPLFSTANSVEHELRTQPAPARGAGPTTEIGALPHMADVTAVFSSRSAFSSTYPASALLDRAKEINAAGLSLNMLCQNYPDHQLRRLLESGTRIRCLFLDPNGQAIRAREAEEGHIENTLTTLTALNISVLTRLRDRLDPASAQRLELHVYDETIRFNILIVDRALCVVQPYLPQARGVDSPTLVIRDNTAAEGLFPVFDQVFTEMWERSKHV